MRRWVDDDAASPGPLRPGRRRATALRRGVSARALRRASVVLAAVFVLLLVAVGWWLRPDRVSATGGSAAADHRGWYPTANVEAPQEMRWRRDRNTDAYGDIATPAVVGDNVFVASNGTVAAFGARDGELRWRVELDGAAAVASDLSLLYVLAADSLHALEPDDGTLRWSVRLAAGPGADVVHRGNQLSAVGGTVTARTAQGGLVAVSSGGRIAWSHGPDDLAFAALDAQRVAAGPLRFGTFVLVVTAPPSGGEGAVQAFDLRSGERVWAHSIPSSGHHRAVLHGAVVAFTAGDSVIAMDATSGRRRWVLSRSVGAETQLGVASGLLAVVTPAGVDFIDLIDGTLERSTAGPGQPVTAVGPSVLAFSQDETLAVLPLHTEDGGVQALAPATGETVWRRDFVGAGVAASSGVPGTVLTPTTTGRLLALGAGDGQPRWERRLAGALACGLSGGGELTFLVDEGRLHAFHADEGTVAWTYAPENAVTGVATADTDVAAVVDTAGVVSLLDVADGVVVGTFPAGRAPLGEPVLADEQVLVAGGDEARSGDVDVTGWIRSSSLDDDGTWIRYAVGPFPHAPTVADGRVVAVTTRGFLQTFDAATGAPVWDGIDRLPPTGPAAIATATVVVADRRGRMTALDLETGATQWQVTFETPLRRRPAIADGFVVTRSDDTTIEAYDLATGDRRWQRHFERVLTSPVSVGAGGVYVGTRSGLAVLDLETGQPTAPHVGLTAPPIEAPILGSAGVTVCQADGSVVALGNASAVP